MAEVNLNLNQPTPEMPPQGPTPKKKKERKDSFTKLQSTLLILLTLILSAAGWYAVGKYYFWTDLDMKRVNGQLEFLKQKVQAEPNNAKTRVELGYTYFLKGKEDQAIQELNQAIILDAKNFDAYYNLGLIVLKEKKYDEALERFQKCVELSPKDYKGHLEKGIAYRNLGMFKEASESLAQANKLLPGSADIIYQIGKVAEDQGQKDAAIEIYKEALSYDPLYKDAINSLDKLNKK